MPFIQVNSKALQYRLRRSQRAKRLQMSFRSNTFEVVAPLKIKNSEILHFIKAHLGWMLKQHIHPRFNANKTSLWPSEFLANEVIHFREKPVRLNVSFGKQKALTYDQQSLNITVPWSVEANMLGQHVKQQVVHWYKQEALKAIEQALNIFCPQMGRWPSSVQVKKQKTRWGSCGIKDKININWLLMAAPAGVLEYVVVHELCHLFHRNHGKRFWSKVEKYFPEYERVEKWLSQHGQSLFL